MALQPEAPAPGVPAPAATSPRGNSTLPAIRRRSSLSLTKSLASGGVDAPIPKPRQHICEEVSSIVAEHAPSDNSKPSLVRRQPGREGGWAEELSRRCSKARERAAECALTMRTCAARGKERRNAAEELQRILRYEPPGAQPPTPWRDYVWQRNRLCEYCVRYAAPGCERMECKYCNVVAHVRCALPQSRTACAPRAWVCRDCTMSLEDTRRHQIVAAADHKAAVTRHMNAVIIQARARAYLDCSPYRKLRKGVVSIQGALRCFSARKQFRQKYTNQERPFAVTIRGASGLRDDDEYFCLLSVVRGTSGQPDPDQASLSVRETPPGTTLYQYATKAARRDPTTNALTLDAHFLIPNSVCGVLVYVTLVSKVPQHVVEADNLTCNIVFRGQVHVDAEKPLLYYQKIHKALKANVFPDHFELREKPGSTQGLRMLHGQTSHLDAPTLTLDLVPCSQASTHFGLLDEVSSVFSRKSVKRRWWCLLVENNLYFYRAHHDPTPVLTFHLSRSNIKVYPESGVLEIKSLEQTRLVSTSDQDARSEWFRMLKRNFDNLKTRSAGAGGGNAAGGANGASNTQNGSGCGAPGRTCASRRRASFSFEDLTAALRKVNR